MPDSTRPSSVIAVGAIIPVLGIIAVVSRFTVRRQLKNPILIDDWILIPALFLTIAMGASLIAGVRLHALGYHTPFTGDPNDPTATLTEKNFATTTTSQIEWAFQMMQVLALGCVKLSFLCFYKRIFVTQSSRWFRTITFGMIVLIVIWTIAFFFALLFACKGDWSAWWGSVLDLTTRCVKTLKLEMGLVTTDFITDAFVLILPIPKIWALQMPIGKKVAVMGVFGLGLVAVAASIVRMNQFIHVIEVGFDPHADEDLSLTSNLYWSMVESGLGLIAVCLPTCYRPLFGRYSPESLLNSIRSAFSLRPRSSQHDSQTRWQNGRTEQKGGSSESFTCMVGERSAKLETYAMRDISSLGDAMPNTDQNIHVKKTMTSVEDVV